MLEKRANVENVLIKSLPAWAVACVAACTLLSLGLFGWVVVELTRSMTAIGGQLVGLGWAKTFGFDMPLLVFMMCLGDQVCAPGANHALEQSIPYTLVAAAVAPTLAIAAILGKFNQNKHIKMPGQQRWATQDDHKIQLYTEGDKSRPENKQSGYLGYFMQPRGVDTFDLRELKMLMPPVEDRSANTMVIGGTGSGKTSGLFIPAAMNDAIQGNSCVMMDLKYPNKKGLYNMIAFWHRLGRNVQLFTPFSEDTLHLPLLDGVTDRYTALQVADSIMPPPEHQAEVGKHYKNVERDVLASILLAVANHPVPAKRNFREVLRITQFTKTELAHWYQKESLNNPEIKEAMKGLFDRNTAANADMLRGLLSELKIFLNPVLERSTTSQPGHNLDLTLLYREPTLLYIGIEQEYIEDGAGEVLLKLIKRMIDRAGLQEATRQGGILKIHVESSLDEFFNLGKLGNMLRAATTKRERNMGMTLGIQNSSGGRLVYGELAYKAMTDNVMGHTVLLPYGITGEDAAVWSKLLGNTTRIVPTEGTTEQAFLPSPFDRRKTKGQKVERQAFLSPEEFATFTKNEGILLMMGCPPVRIKLPRFDEPWVVKPQGWFRPGVRNKIEVIYRRVMGHSQPGELTDALLTSPAFRARTRATAAADAMPMTPEAMLHAWADAALEQGAPVRLVRASQPAKIYVNLQFDSPVTEEQVEYLVDQKWLARGASQMELRVTETGQALLGEAKVQRLHDAELMGPIMAWMRQRAPLIEHHPVRELLPDTERPEASAYYEAETLAVPSTVLKELLGVVPELPSRRVGTRNLMVISLNDPAALRAAVEAARAADPAAPEARGWGKVRVETSLNQPLPEEKVLGPAGKPAAARNAPKRPKKATSLVSTGDQPSFLTLAQLQDAPGDGVALETPAPVQVVQEAPEPAVQEAAPGVEEVPTQKKKRSPKRTAPASPRRVKEPTTPPVQSADVDAASAVADDDLLRSLSQRHDRGDE